jgi:hypothetical protein
MVDVQIHDHGRRLWTLIDQFVAQMNVQSHGSKVGISGVLRIERDRMGAAALERFARGEGEMVSGRPQMNKNLASGLQILAAAMALTSCAATDPTKPTATSAATGAATVGGYRRVVRNGQTYYCIKEIPTGSLMVQETCLAQAQMDAEQEKARNFAEGVQGIATLPPSPNAH